MQPPLQVGRGDRKSADSDRPAYASKACNVAENGTLVRSLMTSILGFGEPFNLQCFNSEPSLTHIEQRIGEENDVSTK